MDKDAAEQIAIGFTYGLWGLGFFLMLGLAFSSPKTSVDIDVRSLGEKIGDGLAHAACIDAGKEWRLDECRPPLQ